MSPHVKLIVKGSLKLFIIPAPGLTTSDSTQALQAAAFPTIPYPGVGRHLLLLFCLAGSDSHYSLLTVSRLFHQWTGGMQSLHLPPSPGVW